METQTDPSPHAGHDQASGFARGAVVGRYVVLQRLGAGGMGVVHAAYDPELDRKVALKLLLPGMVGDTGRARLLREAQALARLSHPNVVAIHDVGTVGEQVWLAMELVQGQTLGEWLRTPRGRGSVRWGPSIPWWPWASWASPSSRSSGTSRRRQWRWLDGR
jgi:serine/threonine protein kinase